MKASASHVQRAWLAADPRAQLQALPARLVRGLPAIILGVLLNTLDAASTGLLVFPSAQEGPQFAHIQVQAMAIYIMSTITSQLTLTLGGSLFPGSLGSMLIEVLPFLRGMATDIQAVLGADSPKLLPTVVAAYALTSFLIGFCFIALGLLRQGWIVEYFPRTVLTGTIGAIGLSLFLLSLQLTLPPTAPALTLSNAHAVLFNPQHGPILAASLVPTVLLCVSLRLDSLSRLTRGFTEHAMYVPLYVLAISALFWIIVAAKGLATGPGMDELAAQGWLFTVDASSRPATGLGTEWNYWVLFNFGLVEWSAMSNAIQNIVLTVVVGVLNLPIYIPAMAVMLNEPKFSMNWELIGHGISNLLSGATGSLPNLVVLSNTRLFTFAAGGRPEALVVTGFTIVLFFVSARLLPYVPTILASVLVFFLGIELMTDAVWASTKELLLIEWLVVIGTMVACTFVGFLPGFAIGIALAVVSHVLLSTLDTRARLAQVRPRRDAMGRLWTPPTDYNTTTTTTKSAHVESRSLDGHDSPEHKDGKAESSAPSLADHPPSLPGHECQVVSVQGTLFFATVPELEKQIDAAFARASSHTIVIDFCTVTRAETCVGSLLQRKWDEFVATGCAIPYILTGLTSPNDGLAQDLARAGLKCHWPQCNPDAPGQDAILCYRTLASGLAALESTHLWLDSHSDAQVWAFAARHLGGVSGPDDGDFARAIAQCGAKIHRLEPGRSTLLKSYAMLLVVQGSVCLEPASISARGGPARPSTALLGRTALFSSCQILVATGISKMTRLFRASRALPSDSAAGDAAQQHLLEAHPLSRVTCQAGDVYVYVPQSCDEESGSAPGERALALQEGPACLVSIPADAEHIVRRILLASARQRLHEQIISSAVHR